MLTESVSSADALIFLAGANLGAAAYEYGLAGVTARVPAPPLGAYASFDADWDPATT